jgi:hypothetical protein
MRPQRLNLSAQIGCKEILESRAQHLTQYKKLQIGDASLPVFQPGEGTLAGIPSRQLQFYGKLMLGPALLFTELANLRPDYI